MHACVILVKYQRIQRTGKLSIQPAIYHFIILVSIELTFLVKYRIPKNCAFTKQESCPEDAQTKGWPSKDSLELNSGMVVVKPCPRIYEEVKAVLQDGERTAKYDFADQSLLSDVYRGKWLALPYIYNALKTLKWHHTPIWQQENVKNVHYILAIKPWDTTPDESTDETFPWWWSANNERLEYEERQGIADKW